MPHEVEEHRGRHIAVAVDRTEEAMDALKWTLEKICKKGDKLVILHATCPLQEPSISDMDFMFHRSPTACHMLDDMAQKEEEAAKALVASCQKVVEAKGIECHTLIEEGDPREVICSFVAAFEPDLLVVASRGPATILKRSLLGSVSDYVVRHATCPVIVARPTAHTLEKKRQAAVQSDRFGLTSWVWAEDADDVDEES